MKVVAPVSEIFHKSERQTAIIHCQIASWRILQDEIVPVEKRQGGGTLQGNPWKSIGRKGKG